MAKDFLWRLYEHQTAALFSQIPGAQVVEDAHEIGVDSQQDRQIDVLVTMPLEVHLRGGFRISVPVKIIVDCKDHGRPLDLPGLGEIEVLRKDLRANLAVVVSRHGISEAAGHYAEQNHIVSLPLPRDLVAQLFGGDDDVSCQLCDHSNNEIDWRHLTFLTDLQPQEGHCQASETLHVRCPDCFTVFAVETSGSLSCPTPCEAVFDIDYDCDTMEFRLRRVYDSMESTLLRELAKNNRRRLPAARVDRIIAATRWQYWDNDRS